MLEMLPVNWKSLDGGCGSSTGTCGWDQRRQRPQAPGDALSWETTHS